MGEVKFYLSLVLRRLHWVVLVVALGSAAAIWGAGTLPTTYRAQATLLAESEQIPDELAASTVRVQTNEQIQIIRQRVLTRNVLIELANRLDVYADRRAAGRGPMDGDAIVEDMRDRIDIRVTGQGGARGATILTVAFRAPDAALAASVANELVDLMLQESVSMRRGAARQTLEFFEQEVDRLDRELARRSSAILEFKQANMDALPDTLSFNRSQMTVLQERLFQIERQEIELRERRDQLLRLQAAAPAGTGTPDINTPEAAQLRELKRERDRQLILLAPENPRIRMLDAQIGQLEEVVAEQAAADAALDPGQAAGLSPLEIQIADLERQIANVEAQKPRIEAQLDQINEIMAAIPGVTAQLEALERDYAATQSQYNRAVASRAQAETGDTIETMARGQRLSIIEPATAPRRPESPNRPLIMAGGGVGSLALGVGLVLLLNLLKPVIRRPDDLTRGLGITPFATLPYLQTRREILRRRLALWAGAATAAVLLAVGLWYVDSEIMPLDLVVEQVRARFG